MNNRFIRLINAVILLGTITLGAKAVGKYLGKKIDGCDSKLGHIKGAVQDISQQLNNIEDNILDDLRDIRLIDKLGKTSPNVPTPLPCYAPNGICTNPQMDCIGCPKRGTGGTWSTSTNTIKED